jgi:hypothetical protein
MTLGFSTKIDGKLTRFPEKILASVCKYNYEHYLCASPSEFKGSYFEFCEEKGLADFTQKLAPKLHTIREDKVNRWKAGRLIHFVVGNRTKKRFQFAPLVECVSVQELFIEIQGRGSMKRIILFIDNAHKASLSYDDSKNEFGIIPSEKNWVAEKFFTELAINDGFECLASFVKYFSKTPNFKGKLIHWTDKRY